jgi:hypothetical protein
LSPDAGSSKLQHMIMATDWEHNEANQQHGQQDLLDFYLHGVHPPSMVAIHSEDHKESQMVSSYTLFWKLYDI